MSCPDCPETTLPSDPGAPCVFPPIEQRPAEGPGGPREHGRPAVPLLRREHAVTRVISFGAQIYAHRVR